MHDDLQDFVLLLFAAGFSAVGWLMAHNPGRAYRFFTFGMQPENKFGVGFFRICGWVFTVVFAIGAMMYLGGIVRDMLQ